jgi:hypothetical protein
MGIRDDGAPDRRQRIGLTEADVTRKGRTYQHTNRDVLIEGGPLPIRLRRSRATKRPR